MAKDLTLVLEDRPGTLADAADALGRAGVNIVGGCGFPAGSEGILHVLVEDVDTARRAVEEAGIEVRDEREVVVLDPIPDQPGALAAILRPIADRGVNVNLVYATADGRIVLSGEDVGALEAAVRA